jgi:hypothetical protein
MSDIACSGQPFSGSLFAMSLYRAIDVWERKDSHTVVRYRCFESLDTGRYSVQSADFYHEGTPPANSDVQFVELFTEQDPAERSGEHATLKDAIAAHNREFAERGN